jgi:uncharacterized membrane protein
MPGFAIVFGLLMTALSAVAYLNPELLGTVPPIDPEKGPPSKVTALIPGCFGIALILCGLISLGSPEMRKHAMHIAAMVSLLGIVGALFRPLTSGKAWDFDAAPLRAQLMMAVLSAIFLFLCVRSFIQARKARQAREAATSPTPGV